MSNRNRVHAKLSQVSITMSVFFLLPFAPLLRARPLLTLPFISFPTHPHPPPAAQQIEAIREEMEGRDDPWVEFPDLDEDNAVQWYDFTLTLECVNKTFMLPAPTPPP